eukprot:8050799-Alexandrium_andersonii.AAC.1
MANRSHKVCINPRGGAPIAPTTPPTRRRRSVSPRHWAMWDPPCLGGGRDELLGPGDRDPLLGDHRLRRRRNDNSSLG